MLGWLDGRSTASESKRKAVETLNVAGSTEKTHAAVLDAAVQTHKITFPGLTGPVPRVDRKQTFRGFGGGWGGGGAN